MGRRMTDASLSARFAEGDFRVGRVLNRTSSVLSRNFLPFFIVTAIANLPGALLIKAATDLFTSSPEALVQGFVMLGLGLVLTIVLNVLCQAIVLYGAFQDMRGRPVKLLESLQVGLSRFFPLVGLGIVMLLVFLLAVVLAVAMTVLGGMILGIISWVLVLIAGMFLITMWFAATPACVVERAGPIRSMSRSSQLTKGHRWKVFGLILLVVIVGSLIIGVINFGIEAVAGATVGLISGLLLNGIWGAFYAIAVVVTYHDLRVAKEGTSIEQIAAVFD
jgi:MFS family permease